MYTIGEDDRERKLIELRSRIHSYQAMALLAIQSNYDPARVKEAGREAHFWSELLRLLEREPLWRVFEYTLKGIKAAEQCAHRLDDNGERQCSCLADRLLLQTFILQYVFIGSKGA